MRDPYVFPKIREPIDVRLETVEGSEAIVLLCPLGLTPEPLVLLGAVAPLLGHFDGNHSVDRIVELYSAYGVKHDLLQQLISLLDQGLFLETPAFFEAKNNRHQAFLKSSIRKAALAGYSYPAEAERLKEQLHSYLNVPTAGSNFVLRGSQELFCLISPHIDYNRGGKNYGITYRHLKGEEHTLYILLGTSHQYSPHLFHLTKKHFETPLGTLSCATEYVDTISRHYGAIDLFADEYLHAREHSLELQTPFLALLNSRARILPVLVGSFYPFLTSGKLPEEHGRYDSFAGALSESVTEAMRKGEKVCFIAGVDMAHVGAYFGDSGKLSPDQMARIASADREYLDIVSRGDHRALFEHVARDGDARKICGFPTLYLLLDVFKRMQVPLDAKLYGYEQAVNYQNDCAVTFAGMGLYTGARLAPNG